ncbi:MAG TPA: hypothetical protein VMH20_18150 [Verrucomicrobiae bacterium]|nr:hypothetical protein [Verrucomicrobiae bacterium]
MAPMNYLTRFIGFVLLAAPLLQAADQPKVAHPGTVNYVEGQATLGTQTITADSIGTLVVDPGQTLRTQNGKVELLLTPGIFLRLGPSAAATMMATTGSIRLSLDQGEAFVEVDQIHPESNVRILQDGVSTEFTKMGLYNLNANVHLLRVLTGEAIVSDGKQSITVKEGHKVDLAERPLHERTFDKKEIEAEDLYRWTMLRSAYLAEANADYAPTYSFGGFGWFGDGWYWDPWFDDFTFLPGDGIFYSPFGWGFYSPFCAFGAPFVGGGHYHRHFNPTTVDTWGPQAHYKQAVNYGHGVHYASVYKSHGIFGGSKGAGFHGIGGGMFRGGGGFHGGGFGSAGGHK